MGYVDRSGKRNLACSYFLYISSEDGNALKSRQASDDLLIL